MDNSADSMSPSLHKRGCRIQHPLHMVLRRRVGGEKEEVAGICYNAEVLHGVGTRGPVLNHVDRPDERTAGPRTISAQRWNNTTGGLHGL